MIANRHSALYLGHVCHARRDEHARRSFRYPVYVAAIDLAELPELDRELRLFSHNRPNVFVLDDRDFERDRLRTLHAEHRARLVDQDLPAPAHVRLVTNLRVLGYTFNPVSFFLGYDDRGELETVVAEVNNTYGGRHRYVLGPSERIAGARARFRIPRVFFVSPFLHGDMDYELVFDTPLDGSRLAITMHVLERHTRVRAFTATLLGDRQPLTDRVLARAALRYPLMTAQVIALIHYEALKLHWQRVPYRRPSRDHRPHPRIPTAR